MATGRSTAPKRAIGRWRTNCSAPSTKPAGFDNREGNVANDVLTGPTGQDWFFADLIGTGTKDKITDLSATEFANDLNFIYGPCSSVAWVTHPGGRGNQRVTTPFAFNRRTGSDMLTFDLFNTGMLGLSGTRTYSITVATFGSSKAAASNFTVKLVNFAFNSTPLVSLTGTTLVVQFTRVQEPGYILGMASIGWVLSDFDAHGSVDRVRTYGLGRR